MLANWRGMSDDTPPPCPLDDLLEQLAGIEASITAAQAIAQAKLGELRRQARARPQRRRRGGTIDTRKYALGGAVVMLAGEVDATTFLGLIAQTDMMLTWMAQERLAHGARPFGTLLGAILDDPRKAAWCRRWGAIIEWAHRKVLYDAGVHAFEASGRAGTREAWRRKAVTDDQADLAATLSAILAISLPDLADRGTAYEWIKAHGGNPAHWMPPPHPDSWSDKDDDHA